MFLSGYLIGPWGVPVRCLMSLVSREVRMRVVLLWL